MKLILFGAGHYGQNALPFFGAERVYCFCDNSVKNGEEKEICGKSVVSFEAFREIYQNYIVVVCIKLEFCLEVCRQLDEAGIRDYVIFEALYRDGRAAEEWVERLQDREERSNIQRKSYLFLLDKAMAQLNYLKRHADIKTLRPAAGELRKLQLGLLDEAKLFFDFIEGLHIKPFLTFGNLIGAVRHQGFVPWDDDLDFGLIRGEYERLLKFAREECVVMTYEPKKGGWVDSDENFIETDMLCKRFPGKYIFNLRPEFIQVSKCTDKAHYYVMDIWAYDFYKNDCDIEDYKDWVEKINKEAGQRESRREKMKFIRKALADSQMVSSEMTDHFFPGIDNYGGYPGERGIEGWIPTKEIFPLQKVKYENTSFWAPRNMETLLKYEYIDYMEFPDEVGLMAHGGTEAD